MMPHYLYEFEVELAYEIDESDKLIPEKLRTKNTERNETKMYLSNRLESVPDFLSRK